MRTDTSQDPPLYGPEQNSGELTITPTRTLRTALPDSSTPDTLALYASAVHLVRLGGTMNEDGTFRSPIDPQQAEEKRCVIADPKALRARPLA